MAHFFRYEPDGLANLNMLLIRTTYIIMLCLAYRYRDKTAILKYSLVVSVVLQFVMLAWYAGDGHLFWREGLPLYHCRIAAIMTALGYVLKRENFTRYFAWLGFIGSTIAFAFPDPAPFLWPHLTNFTYIGTHIVIAMSSLIIITGDSKKLSLSSIILYTLGMNIVLSIANILFKSNYGYLMRLPKMFSFFPGKVQLFIIMSILIVGGTFSCESIYLYIKRRIGFKFKY